MSSKIDACTDLILTVFALQQQLAIAGDALSAPTQTPSTSVPVVGG